MTIVPITEYPANKEGLIYCPASDSTIMELLNRRACPAKKADDLPRRLDRLAKMVLGANAVMNLTADSDPLLFWHRHIEDSLRAAGQIEEEIGQPGTDAEKAAIADGKVYFGRGTDTVSVTLPLRDRNGDPIAAVRVRLKSFPGETQDTAIARATVMLKLMQAQVTSREELMP